MVAGFRRGEEMETELDGGSHGRIVALLLALAALADRFAHRSLPVRLLALFVLRHALAAARAYVLETCPSPAPLRDDPVERGRRRIHAALLVLCLRGLLATLDALLHAQAADDDAAPDAGRDSGRYGDRLAADGPAPHRPTPRRLAFHRRPQRFRATSPPPRSQGSPETILPPVHQNDAARSRAAKDRGCLQRREPFWTLPQPA
jgi:hypothetical protein